MSGSEATPITTVSAAPSAPASPPGAEHAVTPPAIAATTAAPRIHRVVMSPTLTAENKLLHINCN
ncbi:hypothetical protein TUSST3_68580 [Streptomyces sp. TUS-ST3]|nr:hypothetical protein TUSST3_68580 [Streptomyces sp. TUS-ST3]